MFPSVLTIEGSVHQPPRAGTYNAGSGSWVGFFTVGTKAAWTRPLSDLRVQVYIPKRGRSKTVRYTTKGLRICFRRWFNMSGIVCSPMSECCCLGGSFNTLCDCQEASLQLAFTFNNFGSPTFLQPSAVGGLGANSYQQTPVTCQLSEVCCCLPPECVWQG